jgi:4-amino-4-deoxy-L-arabinose transferase-like glycosyltransferase
VTRFARGLLVIVVVAFAVRVVYVAAVKSDACPVSNGTRVVATAPSDCPVGDQLFYNAAANRLAQGDGFVEPLWKVTHPGEDAPPAADHPPLTVVVLAPVSWAFDRAPLSGLVDDETNSHVAEHRYTMVVLGTLLVVLIALLARRVGGDAVGLTAATIAALTPNLWVNDGLVMSETVTGLTVVGALLAAFWFRDRPGLGRGTVVGALCGLAALARAELVLLVPLLALVVCLWSRDPIGARLGRAGAALAAGLVVLAPWVGYNLARFEDPTFISTNDGIALAGSNCDSVYRGSSMGLTAITPPEPCIDLVPPPGDQSQVSSVYRDRAFGYMRDHASRVPLVVAARVGRTWSVFRPLDMVSFNEGEGRERTVSYLGLVAYYPTVIAAIAGAVVLWRRRQRMTLWMLCVPALTVTIGVAVTYGQTRFRAAAEPSLAVLAAVALVAAWVEVRARRARSVQSRGAPA